MDKGVSVIICSYNGKNRLTKVLEFLSIQNHSCPIEIILVDNASTDGTKKFADDWWLVYGVSTINYNSFLQPIPGKSYAQELAYSKASYEYLLVCDDDNWLAKNYVQTSFDIMESNIKIGALGGWCEAEFEGGKPEWFDSYAKFFAVSKQGDKSGDITHKKGCLYGAGMVLRRSHWVQLSKLGFTPLLTCRKGDTLSSGGDTEYSYVLRLLGYKMWYDERLHFKHYMTNGRLHLKYVSRLRKAMSESNFTIRVYLDELNEKKVTRKTFLKTLYREVKDSGVINIKRRLFGSFEEQEIAKEYFRNLWRLIFSYNKYCKNRATIKNWLPSNHQSI